MRDYGFDITHELEAIKGIMYATRGSSTYSKDKFEELYFKNIFNLAKPQLPISGPGSAQGYVLFQKNLAPIYKLNKNDDRSN